MKPRSSRTGEEQYISPVEFSDQSFLEHVKNKMWFWKPVFVGGTYAPSPNTLTELTQGLP